MAETVYILCALTSGWCAALLLRAYQRRRTRLLLWSGLCFLGLTVNNILLFVDLIVVPAVDLSVHRRIVACVAMSMLLFGLIWEVREP